MQSLAAKPSKPVKPIKEGLFEIIETDFGTWRLCDSGVKSACGRKMRYREFTSHAEILGRPLVSIANGIDPRTKKWATAAGFIAIGQRASGIIAIGQFCNGGLLAIGQFCSSRFFALGQFTIAPVAIGQFSLAAFTVAQAGLAGFGLFQAGINVWNLMSSWGM